MTQAQQHLLLDRFGRGVREDAARSLIVLRTIEETVDALDHIAHKFDADTKFAHKTVARISAEPREEMVDPEGTLGDSLLAAQESIKPLYDLLIEKRIAAINAAELTEEDGVVDAYTRAIASAADLHNILDQLRETIGEHDADLDTDHAETFDNCDSLLEALRK